MALPVTFASLSTVTLSQLDQNFNALGALTPIPCSVSGTNALVLTPFPNTPAVPVLQNYQMFTGIAANTSNGSITAQISGLSTLNVYQDSSSGVSQAGAGAIVAATAFTLMYDSTLNAGAGGFHLLSAVAVGAFLPLTGGTLSGALTGTAASFGGNLVAATCTIAGALSAVSVTGTSIVAAPTIAATTLFSGTAMRLSGGVSVNTALIGGGQAITRALWVTATLAFGSIGPGTTSDQTVTMSNVQVGDSLLCGVPAMPTVGLVFFPFCATAGVVNLRAANLTTLTLTPPSGVYQLSAIGFT